MRKKDLEIILEKIPPYSSPKIELEQYATPVTIVSRLLWIAGLTYDDIAGKKIIDLGSGTGRIGLGAVLMGAAFALLLDIDVDSLIVAWQSAKNLKLDGIADVVVADVLRLPLREGVLFDTALQNPPFGVHRRGIDVEFLAKARELARVIYSIHKKSTKGFLEKYAERLGCSVETVFVDELCIPPIYAFHTKRKHCVEIVVLRIECGNISWRRTKNM